MGWLPVASLTDHVSAGSLAGFKETTPTSKDG